MTRDLEVVEGGVCAPRGFRASSACAGFYAPDERDDLAVVVADAEPSEASCAAVFTRNTFAAGPVVVSREVLSKGRARAVILNAGNANAATGEAGVDAAREVGTLAAWRLGLEPDEVFVASTGVIGVPLALDPFHRAMPSLLGGLSTSGGGAAARAIMTTDTHPKEHAVRFMADGVTYSVGGMCKGAGMIQPDMATMLAVITTDMPIDAPILQEELASAVDLSFNRVTVDSDTSTNDSVFLLSSGAAGGIRVGRSGAAHVAFRTALRAVCTDLARQIAADGEGSTRLVTVTVKGAASDADADLAARAIANSPLVKTAIAGRDCNWGRVAAALGKSGAAFEASDVDIDFLGLAVCRNGMAREFSEEMAKRRFEEHEVTIDVSLGTGGGEAFVWTCDLTHDYVSINADYRS